MKRLASIVLVAAAAAGCASAQAKAPADRPALDVPVAPPRIIEKPADTALPEPVSELPPPPVAARPRPQQTPAREPARPEPKPDAPVEPPPAPAAAAPAPVAPILRTPGTADSAVVSRQVRDVLDRAKKMLESIDYRRLTKDRRAQYDNAKLMIKECDEAVKTANFEYARSLADKAERLAKELQTR